MRKIHTPRVTIPALGLGTWPLRGQECVRAVAEAIEVGYRHIDTAEMYGNEAEVAEGIRASGIDRKSVFVTSKVWWENLADPDRAIDASLARMKFDYVDLFLIHWPNPRVELGRTLETMVGLRALGFTRSIGVANFPSAMLRDAIETYGAPIAVNQVEYHVMLSQAPMLKVARDHDVVVTAYSPLGKGGLVDDPVLARIGAKHGASGPQVALAWLLAQDRVAAIPKTARRENMVANLKALELKLDPADLAELDALPKNRRFLSPTFAPAWDEAA